MSSAIFRARVSAFFAFWIRNNLAVDPAEAQGRLDRFGVGDRGHVLVAAARPGWLYPLMALDNAVLTYVIVRVWLPRQDVEKIKTRRVEIGRRARRMFLDGRSRAAPVGRADDE